MNMPRLIPWTMLCFALQAVREGTHTTAGTVQICTALFMGAATLAGAAKCKVSQGPDPQADIENLYNPAYPIWAHPKISTGYTIDVTVHGQLRKHGSSVGWQDGELCSTRACTRLNSTELHANLAPYSTASSTGA